MRVLKIEEDGEHDYLIITVEEGFGPFKKERKLRGSCTVWNRLPDFERAGTHTEYWLVQVWKKYWYEKKQASKKVGAR